MKKLPIVSTPEYPMTLPSSGKKIKIRPFLGEEEKILLMALEGGGQEDIKEALKQIINNCIITKGIEVEKLENIDVEALFIELRRRSVSETVDLTFDMRELFECAKDTCPETQKIRINLADIEIKNLSKEKKIIMLDDKIGVVLKHPSIDIEINETSKTGALFEMIAACIKEVFDDSDTTPSEEFEKETLIAWVGSSFQHKQIEEAIDFLSNQPYHYKSIDITCKTCGMTKTQEAKGLVDFFTL